MVLFMKKYALLRYCLVFLAIVLPYFSAATINGPERVLAERVPDMEEYLPVIVFSQISPDMKKETIKAQTVIARSNIQRWLGEGKNLAEILRENGSTEEVWRYFFAEKRQIYEQAAKETDGQVLTYEGKVRLTPWHKRSAGKTRSGEEVFHDEAYTYLKSADSSEDKKISGSYKNRGNSCGAAFRGAEDQKTGQCRLCDRAYDWGNTSGGRKLCSGNGTGIREFQFEEKG